MEEQAKNRILKQLDYLEKNKDKLTMDADTHPSPSAYDKLYQKLGPKAREIVKEIRNMNVITEK